MSKEEFEELKDNRYWLAFFVSVYELYDNELITASRGREMLGYPGMMDFREWRKNMEAAVLSRPNVLSNKQIRTAHDTLMMLDSYLSRLMTHETTDDFNYHEKLEIGNLIVEARDLCKHIEKMSGEPRHPGGLGPMLGD